MKVSWQVNQTDSSPKAIGAKNARLLLNVQIFIGSDRAYKIKG